jgi:N-methylhydantoinase A/oxoprolinase/acetone carboxylase beta subunit
LIARAEAALSGERESVRVAYELRYVGQSFELSVEQSPSADARASAPDPQALSDAFAVLHEQRYGYRDDEADVELVNVRVSAWGPAPVVAPRGDDDGELMPGARLHGPCVYALGESTLYVPDGWSGVVDAHGTIALEDGT